MQLVFYGTNIAANYARIRTFKHFIILGDSAYATVFQFGKTFTALSN